MTPFQKGTMICVFKHWKVITQVLPLSTDPVFPREMTHRVRYSPFPNDRLLEKGYCLSTNFFYKVI